MRVIAATNRDLEIDDARGQSSGKISTTDYTVIEITVPPLRERIDEVHRLFEYLRTRKYATRYNRSERRLSPALRDAMERYTGPGNIRELENVVKRFVILQDEALLRFRHSDRRTRPACSERSQPGSRSPPPQRRAPMSTGPALSLPERAKRAAMLQAERDLIIPTLHRVHWNRRKAAPLLGISYKTLLNKLREHGVGRE